MSSPRFRFVAGLFGFSVFVSTMSFAGIDFDSQCGLGGWTGYISCVQYPVFILVVKEVSPQTGTQGTPPLVKGEIVEVLRGNVPQKLCSLSWGAGFHGVDWVGDEAKKTLDKSKHQILPEPLIGSKWIVAAKYDESRGIFAVTPPGRSQYSRELLDETLKTLKK